MLVFSAKIAEIPDKFHQNWCVVQILKKNIFGGILQCDVLTQSILNAAKEVGLSKPIVLRLKGTNSDIAKKMLEGK